jgi:phytoene/squalene synthetase
MPDLSPALPPAPEAFVVLLPKRLLDPAKQPALTAMADFMSLSRSIADDPKMQPLLKTAHLTALDGALTTDEGYVALPKGVSPTIRAPGFTLRRESDRRTIPVVYGRRVIQAYKQDIAKKAYRDWSELLGYFRFSAGSSAQYAVEALGLDRAAMPAAEGLASANALVRRLASVREDFTRTKRLYLPLRWLNDAGLDTEEITLDGNNAAWLTVRDQSIVQARQLLSQSAPGIKAIKNWRLRLAFAWAKADIDARCDAIAAAPSFPAVTMPKPSAIRQILASVRGIF